ncbi:hypothetical protein CRUP_028374, partial [Coryphaenoides rupestris]
MTTGAVGGFWNDKSCLEEFSFVCEKPRPDITPPTKAPTPPPSPDCGDSSWTSKSDFKFCYRLFHNMDYSDKKSWNGAHADCHMWSDLTPLGHTNWGPGEPNNHEGRENCVEMVSNANGSVSWWNDLNCDAHQDWICMIPKGVQPILPPVPPSPEP